MGYAGLPLSVAFAEAGFFVVEVDTDHERMFIELARRIDVSMPHYVFGRIGAALNAAKKPVNGSRVLVLGVAYKPNSSDLRESPSLKILDLLDNAGADAAYHDPHVPELPDRGLRSVAPTDKEFARSDYVVIATDHDAVDLGPVVAHAEKVVDLRDAVRRKLGRLFGNVDVLRAGSPHPRVGNPSPETRRPPRRGGAPRNGSPGQRRSRSRAAARPAPRSPRPRRWPPYRGSA